MRSKAFTLIELLVVVAIIGILAAVGVVAYNGDTGAAKVNATKTNHKLVEKYITHLRWSGWKNPYDTAEEASAEKCNSKPGCTEIWNQTEILQSGNMYHQTSLSHHTLKTYYKDKNMDLKTLEELIKVSDF